LLPILLSPAEAGSRLLLTCTQRLRAGLMNSAATRLGFINAAPERLTLRWLVGSLQSWATIRFCWRLATDDWRLATDDWRL